MLRKGNAKDIKNMGTKNILRFPNKVGNKLHPTEKNIDMIKVLIANSVELTNKHIVLDPFMGCGTTILACRELGVGGIGIEIDKYFDVAVERIKAVE